LRRRARPSSAALAALILAALIAGGVAVTAWARSVETDTATYTGRAQVLVQVQAGSIDVIASEREGIRVVTTTVGSLRRPRVSVGGDSATLLLRSHCTQLLGGIMPGSCRVDYRIEVPASTRVVVETQRGDLTAKGMAASARLATRSGDITVKELAGPLELSTATGSIRADVAADQIEAHADRGSVTIVADHPPAQLRAASETGDIDLTLPPAAYALDIAAASGKVDSEVRTDRRSPYHVWARSAAGDVYVAGNRP
jgi:hypothetical protein